MHKRITITLVLFSCFMPSILFAGACYVEVVSPTGAPMASVVLQGVKSDETTTDTFVTNAKGKAVVRWNDNLLLQNIRVDGQLKVGCDHAKMVKLITGENE